MKIILLGGDGPESKDEIDMYENVRPRMAGQCCIKTTLPINPAKNFNDWMKHIISYSQSLSRDWRSHYNIHQ